MKFKFELWHILPLLSTILTPRVLAAGGVTAGSPAQAHTESGAVSMPDSIIAAMPDPYVSALPKDSLLFPELRFDPNVELVRPHFSATELPAFAKGDELKYEMLTDEDYRQVAAELDVDIAAIKAVVDIEAGASHRGFSAPGKPIINFDMSIYRQMAKRHGVSLATVRKRAPEVFRTGKDAKTQAGRYRRLEAACRVHRASALESCFWGMFQIGGFNWRKCGCTDVEEFVTLMSRSERDQLEIFARFISANPAMVEAIRKHQWLKFALAYNGPRARSRGYDRRMAAAYKKHGGK